MEEKKISQHDVEIAKRLYDWFVTLEISKAEFGRRIGMRAQHVNRLFTGEQKIYQYLDKIEELGGDTVFLKTGKKDDGKKWWEKVDATKLPVARPVENLPPDTKVKLMLSPVQAGEPTVAYSEIQAEVAVGKHYHEKSYMVQARGESMTGAGIEEGDWLLVDEEREPQNGNVVLARVGDHLTIKRLKKNGDCWLLNPENSDFDPIPCNADVDIVAVVIKKEVMFV